MMKTISATPRKLVLVATAFVGLAGILGAGAAQARDADEVRWSVTVGSHQPVYAQPAYPRHAAPPPHYHHHRHGYRQPTRWDRDGDGIPNRHDRLYNPAWDRDGDGVPNRYDRYDRNGWRR